MTNDQFSIVMTELRQLRNDMNGGFDDLRDRVGSLEESRAHEEGGDEARAQAADARRTYARLLVLAASAAAAVSGAVYTILSNFVMHVH